MGILKTHLATVTQTGQVKKPTSASNDLVWELGVNNTLLTDTIILNEFNAQQPLYNRRNLLVIAAVVQKQGGKINTNQSNNRMLLDILSEADRLSL